MAHPDPHALPRHQVVVIGGGFGGLRAARGLRRADVAVTLVDRRNFHLFQPLLYQVASGWLSPAEIAAPLRPILRKQANAEVLLGEVVEVDLDGRRVVLADGERLRYDTLVVAAGARTQFPPGLDWESRARGLKRIEDAIDIRRQVLLAFETAERERRRDEDDAAARQWLRFVVIGGGTTGVEMAGVLGELAREIIRGDFRHFDPGRAEIVLVHSRDRILPEFDHRLSEAAAADLGRLGVRVVTNARVARIDDTGVVLRHGDDAHEERIDARTVLWAAGVRAVELGERLCRTAGLEPAPGGLVPVAPDLTLPGHPEVFVIGDLAAVTQDGELLPGVAPVAMQGGAYVARAIGDRLARKEVQPFHYRDKGLLATIGRGAAVAQLGRLRFDGFLAWIVWVFIHLLYLVGFQSRLVVILRWAWDFAFHQRGARLITGSTAERMPIIRPSDQVPTPAAIRAQSARRRRGGLRVGSVGRR